MGLAGHAREQGIAQILGKRFQCRDRTGQNGLPCNMGVRSDVGARFAGLRPPHTATSPDHSFFRTVYIPVVQRKTPRPARARRTQTLPASLHHHCTTCRWPPQECPTGGEVGSIFPGDKRCRNRRPRIEHHAAPEGRKSAKRNCTMRQARRGRKNGRRATAPNRPHCFF